MILDVCKNTNVLRDQTVWIIRLNQASASSVHSKHTLLLSKASEAILPNTPGNAQGPGSTIDTILACQPGIRFILNGGYNHYRHDFYDWPHDRYHVGDPVGIVKIRDHRYHDVLQPEGFGFFVQEDKGLPWRIVASYEALDVSSKYILGCTPLLIWDGQKTNLSPLNMEPMPAGQINPPSYLGHGLQVHPRTAVGMDGDDIVFVVVENNAQGTGGCTLLELQHIGLQTGLDAMLNLDGGGSTQFRWWNDHEWIGNYVHPDDSQRVLGNTIILFDDQLKPAFK